MLETDKGREQLADFVKLRLYIDHEQYGETYIEFAKRLFNYEVIPMYVIINSQGEITAYEADISVFNAQAGGDKSKTPEIAQKFFDTSKQRGDPFDFKNGFLPPGNAPKDAAAKPAP